MANKRALLGGVSVKTENRSGFDKSRLNILTTKVGTITPIAKQLVIPSSGRIKVTIHAQLPPLAADAYLRSHLKVESFYVPMRLCYGGFESWFCGKEILTHDAQGNEVFTRAKLPRYGLDATFSNSEGLSDILGVGSLADYFGVKVNCDSQGVPSTPTLMQSLYGTGAAMHYGIWTNVFPWVAYHLIYDEWYRNKNVQRPAFAPIETYDSFNRQRYKVAHLPYSTFKDIRDIISYYDYQSSEGEPVPSSALSDTLLDGVKLFQLRQRNYGDDYFTCATPRAQEGNPVVVNTSGNQFTISALRMQNALQEFAEVNQYASPDYVQTMSARYGTAPSAGVAQKPVLLGSADFPFFTRGVAITSPVDATSVDGNPFVLAGAPGSSGGQASANGQEFVCDFDVKEPGYILVLATFVPEANYASGVAKDMLLFTGEGSLVDMPCGLLEHVGNEEILVGELDADGLGGNNVFGYVQRYLWHKAGQVNEVHGLYRKGQTLQSFVPQRDFQGVQDPSDISISSNFLQIGMDDLDGITAIQSWLSEFGVMIDSMIDMKVSEPLSESALPALSNPAIEHGRSVYLRSGGSKLD